MKKLAVILCLSFLLPLFSYSEVGPSVSNEKKGKITGAYSTSNHSQTRNYNKKKFKFASTIKQKNKSRSTANIKKNKLSN